jgi:deoxyribonucleoside regulator
MRPSASSMTSDTTGHAVTGNTATGRTARNDDVITQTAWLYYHDGLTQNEIASRMGISRASVVNYLNEARRRDYVRVSLDSDVFRNTDFAARLKQRFDLTDAMVVPVDATAETSFDRVTRAASDWLPTLLLPGDRLGVAWGETIYRLAEAAPKRALSDVTIVQLLGAMPSNIGFTAENCAATLAHKFGAHCANLHAPLLLSNPALCEALKAEPMIAAHLEQIATCNKLLFAAGTLEPTSHIARCGLLDAKTLAFMQQRGAAGVLCGRLIDHSGAPLPVPSEDRMIGVALDQLRGKDMSLLVCASPARASATRAALNGGYATHLATCAAAAQALLEEPS